MKDKEVTLKDKMNIEEFKKLMQQFSSSLDDQEYDDWYATDREVFDVFLEKMTYFFYREEFEKDFRYKQYLKLKEEFGD